MVEQRLRNLLGEVLGLDPGEVGPETSFWSVESWDSVRHVRILTAVEGAFGIRLTATEAGRLLDFPSLVDLLQGHTPDALVTGAVATVASLARDFLERLEALPLAPQGTVLVHSSLRALGAEVGPPEAILEGLIAWVDGRQGTLVLPTMSGRSAGGGFDPQCTPTEGMGILPELFRRRPETLRSHHPLTSFAARGPGAQEIVAHHPLDRPEGPDGPMGRLLERGAQVLLLGVDHEANTAGHLAEYLESVPYIRPLSLRAGGDASRETFLGVGHCDNCSFRSVGEALDRQGQIQRVAFGAARAEFFSMAAAVAAARSILSRDPLAFLCGSLACSSCGPYLRRQAVPTGSGVERVE